MVWRSEKVGVDIKQIANYNPKRKSITVLNIGNYEVYVSQNPTNVLDEGFPIFPLEVMTLTKDEGDEPEYSLYAVSKTGIQELRIHEGVGEK